MHKFLSRLALAAAATLPAVAQADNLAGADRFLCASSRVVRCYSVGDCDSGPPWEWNMPSFIQVDLRKKLLSTPAASAEQRRSPLTHVQRDAGQITGHGERPGAQHGHRRRDRTRVVGHRPGRHHRHGVRRLHPRPVGAP